MPGEAADLGRMRATLGALGLGEVALQEFGQPSDVLIRMERRAGGEEAATPLLRHLKVRRESVAPALQTS